MVDIIGCLWLVNMRPVIDLIDVDAANYCPCIQNTWKHIK